MSTWKCGLNSEARARAQLVFLTHWQLGWRIRVLVMVMHEVCYKTNARRMSQWSLVTQAAICDPRCYIGSQWSLAILVKVGSKNKLYFLPWSFIWLRWFWPRSHRQAHSSQGGDRCGPFAIRLQRGDEQFGAAEPSSQEALTSCTVWWLLLLEHNVMQVAPRESGC